MTHPNNKNQFGKNPNEAGKQERPGQEKHGQAGQQPHNKHNQGQKDAGRNAHNQKPDAGAEKQEQNSNLNKYNKQ